jgi:hypothetical protein
LGRGLHSDSKTKVLIGSVFTEYVGCRIWGVAYIRTREWFVLDLPVELTNCARE